MKRNRYIGLTMMAASLLVATSCTDFNDYNEAPVDQKASGNQTLWENISKNYPDVSDFASLVQRTGFDKKLGESRAFTVWAPKNGTFSIDDYASLSDSALLHQFVENHVADYIHGANGKIDSRIHMLNKKSFSFVGDGSSYKFGNLDVLTANQPSSNGMLHIIDGPAKFYASLYEYLGMNAEVSKLYDYFKHYNQSELSSESVKGPIVDGVQTYLDSVMIDYNTMMIGLHAFIENEDSSYTFVMPTDKAWKEMYDRVRPFYQYHETMACMDFTDSLFTDAEHFQSKTVNVDAAYLADSLTKRVITQNLFFNNNDIYNRWVVNKGEKTDTLRSTNSKNSKFSNPEEILGIGQSYQHGEPVELSNGWARLVDSLAFLSWETYNPVLSISPRNYLSKLFSANEQKRELPDSVSERLFGPDSKVYGFKYSWIEPKSKTSKPDFFVSLPNVKATTYNFYVVYLPYAEPMFGGDARPNSLNFQLYYAKADGTMASYNFSRPWAEYLKNGKTGTAPTENATPAKTTAFENDPEKVDTVFIGQFKFPLCYSNIEAKNSTSATLSPSLRVFTKINARLKSDTEKYNLNVRLARILLVPVDENGNEAPIQ